MTDRTEPDEQTRQAESEDARSPHQPDRAPSPEEEELAEELSPDPEVARHYEEMAETGAEIKGEGQIP